MLGMFVTLCEGHERDTGHLIRRRDVTGGTQAVQAPVHHTEGHGGHGRGLMNTTLFKCFFYNFLGYIYPEWMKLSP